MVVIIEAVQIEGNCPVYRPGSRIVLQEGYILDPLQTDRLCMHSVASMLPYYVAIAKGIPAAALGLSRGASQEAYVHCPDPCRITGGGTVTFQIRRVEDQ